MATAPSERSSNTHSTPRDTLPRIYCTAFPTDVPTVDGCRRGFEPILEKRAAISARRLTSASICSTASGESPRSRSISFHAISDEIGVPS